MEIFFSASPDPSAVLDRDGRVLAANPALAQWLGMPEKALVGSSFFERLAPHEADGAAALRAALASPSGVRRFSAELLAGGCGRCARSAALALARREGEPGAYLTLRDLGKADPEAPCDALLYLREEMRVIFDAAPTMIWYKDWDNRILRVNRLGAETRGLSVAEMEGQPTEAFYPDEAAQYHADDLEVMRSGRPKLGILERHETAGGEKIWVRTDKIPYRDPSGAIIGVIVFATDVSDMKRAEAAQAEVEAVKNLDRLKSEFIGALSHELRTPLTSIRGFAEFLEEEVGGSLTPQQAGFVGQIQRSALQLESLVSDLLDYASLEAGMFSLQVALTDLRPKLAEIAATFEPQLAQRGARLELELPTPLVVWADEQRTGQVFSNLIGNAIKFVPTGGRVQLRVRPDPDGFRCEVADDGEGIAPEELTKLFQRFTQLEGGRRKGGTGLGLSISKAIVEAQGGRIGVESTAGQGATFWFTLPGGPPELGG